MKLKDYKSHIEGLAKMNNPPVSQCIALLRQLYGKLENAEKENKQLKRKLKNCICPHCGYGFKQALKGQK